MESERATARHTEKQTETDKGSWATGRQTEPKTERQVTDGNSQTDTQTQMFHCLSTVFFVVLLLLLLLLSCLLFHTFISFCFISLFCFCFFEHLLILPPNYLSLPTGS